MLSMQLIRFVFNAQNGPSLNDEKVEKLIRIGPKI